MAQGEEKRAIGARILDWIRRNFLTGLAISAPIGLTAYLVWIVVKGIDSLIRDAVPPDMLPDIFQQYNFPGVGLLIVVVGLVLLGFLTKNIFGRYLLRIGEKLVERMPVVRGIYSALKQIIDTIVKPDASSFRQVVLLEYPRPGCWALGFVTSDTTGEVHDRIGEEVRDMVNIFLPTTPNPTSGYLLFVPKSDVTFLKMSVEDGVKMVISAGMITPPAAGSAQPGPVKSSPAKSGPANSSPTAD